MKRVGCAVLGLFKRIDLSDILIIFGFLGFSYGMYEKYGVDIAAIVSGIVLMVMGLVLALGSPSPSIDLGKIRPGQPERRG